MLQTPRRRIFAGRVSESKPHAAKRANAPLFHNGIKIGDNVLSTLLARTHNTWRYSRYTQYSLFKLFTIVFIVFCIVKCISFILCNKLFEKRTNNHILYFSTYVNRYSNPKIFMRFSCLLLVAWMVWISKKLWDGKYHEQPNLPRERLVRAIFEETAIFILHGCEEVFLIFKSLRPKFTSGSPPKICVSKFKGFGRRIANNARVPRKKLLARVHLHLSCTFRRLRPTTGGFMQVYPQWCIGRIFVV